MSEPAQSDRVTKVRQFLRHIGKRDISEVMPLLSPEVTYHVVGSHALSGTYSGHDAVAGHLVDIAERTAGRFDPFKEDDVMVGLDHVCVLVNIRMQADGRTLRSRHVILLRFDFRDQIDHVTVFFENVDAVERFYGK